MIKKLLPFVLLAAMSPAAAQAGCDMFTAATYEFHLNRGSAEIANVFIRNPAANGQPLVWAAAGIPFETHALMVNGCPLSNNTYVLVPLDIEPAQSCDSAAMQMAAGRDGDVDPNDIDELIFSLPANAEAETVVIETHFTGIGTPVSPPLVDVYFHQVKNGVDIPLSYASIDRDACR